MKNTVKSMIAGTALALALASGSTFANQDQFSALGGAEAQTLSSAEMDAVHGALTATQIQTAYFASIDRLVNLSTTDALTAAWGTKLKTAFNTFIMPRLVRIFGL